MSLNDRNASLWESLALPQFSAVERDLVVEIAVLGAGITGLSVAYQLAKRGHQVIVIDAFQVGSGQTGRTTAHLSSQLEKPFGDLLKLHDSDTLKLLSEAHRTAIDTIESIVRDEHIDCDFKRVEGYLFASDNWDTNDLRQEILDAEDCDVDLIFQDRTPLLKDTIPGLQYSGQAQFHPLKYLKGLTHALTKLGVRIYENSHVKEIQKHELRSLLITDSAKKIECEFLVVATNTPVNNRFHIHTKQSAYRTYALAFDLLKPVHDCLLWDTEEPYHYVRVADQKLIVGGEDHRTGQTPTQDPFTNLEKWARDKFSIIGEIHEKWSGQVLEPSDSIAYIGKNPGAEKNVFISTGESGLGMTNATIASLIIPDLIENINHPWAQTFDPSRSVRKGVENFVKENVNTAFQYKDWITGSEAQSLADIPQDHGCLMREGMGKNCVYHAGDEYETKSAVCTHLGGIVHWNDIEKTWDCPCHGSRFTTQGKVIEGPALSDLASP